MCVLRKDKMELISVIIPVYNVEKYLSECVDSVLKQTYENFEIILVDDGSTDGSGAMCNEYAARDSRIRVIHKANGGASSARNVGIGAAAGDYLYFPDSDDYITPDALEKLLNRAEKEDADLVFFDAVSFDEDTGEESRKNYSHKASYETENGLSVMKKLLKNGEFHVSVPLLFMKKELITKNGLRQTEGVMYEDMLFTPQLFAYSKASAYLPEYLYRRRYRKSSVMTSAVTEKNFISARDVLEKLCVFFDPDKLDGSEINAYLTRWALNTLNLYKKLSAPEQKKLKGEYAGVKDLCARREYFGDKTLSMRCRGTAFWAAYKAIDKLF